MELLRDTELEVARLATKNEDGHLCDIAGRLMTFDKDEGFVLLRSWPPEPRPCVECGEVRCEGFLNLKTRQTRLDLRSARLAET